MGKDKDADVRLHTAIFQEKTVSQEHIGIPVGKEGEQAQTPKGGDDKGTKGTDDKKGRGSQGQTSKRGCYLIII